MGPVGDDASAPSFAPDFISSSVLGNPEGQHRSHIFRVEPCNAMIDGWTENRCVLFLFARATHGRP